MLQSICSKKEKAVINDLMTFKSAGSMSYRLVRMLIQHTHYCSYGLSIKAILFIL